MSELTEGLSVSEIIIGDRVRKDFGDLDELANSIREVGLIQPIVLTRDYRLVAGERRLRAMQKLGFNVLVHAKTFIFNDELDELKVRAMEIEENVRRKQLTWQEEILAKKRLLETLQQIHGVSKPGHPSRSDALGITSSGFGVNKLASLLGESNAQTSKDLELAALIEAVPQLAKAETKEAARRQASLATTVAIALQQNKANPPKTDKKWTLWEGDFVNNVNNIDPESIDLVIVDPPYGEDAQGMGPNSKALLATAFADGYAETVNLLTDLAQASYRVLRDARFAAFFFGFRIYPTLVSQLLDVGFTVDTTPLIWVKNSVINTTPYTRYGRSYEPILLARKGEPKLMRPSQRDVISIDNVITRGTSELKLYQAQKPVALIEKLILDLTPPQSTICDFCAGSGTAGEAALRNGRRAILFEKDPVACNIIRARLGGL
jgi:DNA modification methylase/ParB-like chromosome segregation protein Spo0J